jgi:hypothetical protein
MCPPLPTRFQRAKQVGQVLTDSVEQATSFGSIRRSHDAPPIFAMLQPLATSAARPRMLSFFWKNAPGAAMLGIFLTGNPAAMASAA